MDAATIISLGLIQLIVFLTIFFLSEYRALKVSFKSFVKSFQKLFRKPYVEYSSPYGLDSGWYRIEKDWECETCGLDDVGVVAARADCKYCAEAKEVTAHLYKYASRKTKKALKNQGSTPPEKYYD